jgi:hypothetical protein
VGFAFGANEEPGDQREAEPEEDLRTEVVKESFPDHNP